MVRETSFQVFSPGFRWWCGGVLGRICLVEERERERERERETERERDPT